MAKKADDEDDKFEKMDAESLDFLEQVRKGKSRNFVMSVKGGKVKSLLVKKKRVKDKEMKEARGGGFQPMFGVVSGQGGNITFTIAKSDGFEKDPMGGKVQKLKLFLKDQTGKAFKPTVELVATPPPIPFDEDDLNHPLIARFSKLSDLIEQVCLQHPNSSDQTREMANACHHLLSDEETLDQAGPKIDELENYLNGFQLSENRVSPPENTTTEQPAATEPQSESSSDTSSSGPAPEAPAADRSVLAGKLAEGLKKLKPAVQAAIQAAPDKKEVLISSMSQVVTDIKSENLDDAKVNMVALGKLIQEIKAGAASSSATDGDSSNGAAPDPGLAGKLAEALKKLKPAADNLIEKNPDLKTELYTGIAAIAGEIKEQKFDEAAQSVKEFAAKLKSIGAAAADQVQTSSGEDSSSSESEAPVSTEANEDANAESGGDEAEKFAKRRDELEPRLLEAQKADRDGATRLGGIWGYANDQADASNFEKAHATLDRLEKAIEEAINKSSKVDAFGIPKGLVEKRKFMLTRLKQIPIEIKPELESVKSKIIDENADENPDELVSGLDDAFQTLFEELENEINDSINQGDSGALKGLKTRVTQHEVVKLMLENPFTDGSKFQSAILDALDEIEQNLAS